MAGRKKRQLSSNSRLSSISGYFSVLFNKNQKSRQNRRVSQSRSKNQRDVVFYVIGAIISVIAAIVVIILVVSDNSPQNQKSYLSDTQRIIDSVSDILVVIDDDEPLVFTVSDPEKIINETAFSDVREGDQILIYRKKERVVVYRPSIGKIVDILPLNTGN